MRNSPAALRNLAEAYRSIALDIRTQEVRDRLCVLADQFERRAEVWTKLNGPVAGSARPAMGNPRAVEAEPREAP